MIKGLPVLYENTCHLQQQQRNVYADGVALLEKHFRDDENTEKQYNDTRNR